MEELEQINYTHIIIDEQGLIVDYSTQGPEETNIIDLLNQPHDSTDILMVTQTIVGFIPRWINRFNSYNYYITKDGFVSLIPNEYQFTVYTTYNNLMHYKIQQDTLKYINEVDFNSPYISLYHISNGIDITNLNLGA